MERCEEKGYHALTLKCSTDFIRLTTETRSFEESQTTISKLENSFNNSSFPVLIRLLLAKAELDHIQERLQKSLSSFVKAWKYLKQAQTFSSHQSRLTSNLIHDIKETKLSFKETSQLVEGKFYFSFGFIWFHLI